MRPRLLLSCEHGGRGVPARYRACFRGAAAVLASHRGHDLGALALARALSAALRAPLFASTTTRLLVDLNRSASHPRCLSRYVAALAPAERERIFALHYWPHRQRVERALRRLQARDHRVLHVAVHSFTPVLDGVRRSADVGLLYDPRRPFEREVARRWRTLLRRAGCWRVRSNYPYRGTSDGLTTALRRSFSARAYAGIELEVNQKLWQGAPAERRALCTALAETLRGALAAEIAPRRAAAATGRTPRQSGRAAPLASGSSSGSKRSRSMRRRTTA